MRSFIGNDTNYHERSLAMNNQSNTSSLYLYFFTLIFAVFISIPFSHADDDDRREYMGMGYGHMGYGHMGYGHMGYEHIGSHRMGMMGMGYGFLNQLDLSKEQRTTIRNIKKEMRPRKYELKDKVAELTDELHNLYNEDKPNAKKVGEVYKKIFNLKQQQIELSITIKNKIYDVLNKNQKEKLKKLKSSESSYKYYKGMRGRGMNHMMD